MTPTNVIKDNLSKMLHYLNLAKEAQSELVAFPELCLTGHINGKIGAIKKECKEFNILSNYANQNGIYIYFGFAQEEDGQFFNSSALLGPEGVLGIYKKIHLNNEDKKWASEGNEWKFFDTKIGRIGLMIGYDAIFPESARYLGLEGCDIILCAAAQKGIFTHGHKGSNIRQNYPIPMGADPNHWNHFRIRGGENNVYFLYSNVFDEKNNFLGKSGIFGPDPFKFPREEKLILNDEDITHLEIDTSNLETNYPTNVVRDKFMMSMRQPQHYIPLVRHNQKK